MLNRTGAGAVDRRAGLRLSYADLRVSLRRVQQSHEPLHAQGRPCCYPSLRTLRQLPLGRPNRGEFVAFGDPYFSKAEQDQAEKESAGLKLADASGTNTTRGLPLKRRSGWPLLRLRKSEPICSTLYVTKKTMVRRR